LRTPPWPIVVPAISLELARELAGFVATGGAGDDHRALPGVNGPVEPARAFADRWTELTGLKVTTGRNTRLYRLAELVWPSDVPGRFRLAGQADLDLCVAWFEAFADEAHNDDTPRPERADVVARVGANSERLGLWVVNEVPVCMVGWTLPASGVVRVGPVYTPPESRRRGYGAAATAAASALILESGAQVCLFTDLANPTSNSIYQKIGYHPVTDFIELVFE
jgi:GNAT superfamily N-acetyltransferase